MKLNAYVCQYNTPTDRNLLPLALGLILANAKADDVIGEAFDFDYCITREPVDIAVDRFYAPSAIGFSCYMWNFEYSLTIAREIKKRFPKCLIVVGGPAIPGREDRLVQFLTVNRCVDIAVRKEGEQAFAEILRAHQGHGEFAQVKGIAYRGLSGEPILTPQRPRLKNLDALPSPYLDGTFDDILARHKEFITGTIWETNRGCPFSCAFCDWGQATESVVHTYSIERLNAELEWIARNGISYIYAADANFGIKRRDFDIARKMATLRESTGYPQYFMINWLKNSHERMIRIVDALKASDVGCRVTLSMNSNDPETLSTIKRANIKLDTFKALKAEYNSRNVATYTELILGLPGETYDAFTNGIVSVISPYPRDHFTIYLCRILENAELAESQYMDVHHIKTRKCTLAMPRRVNVDSYVKEYETIVVSNSSMSLREWKRAYDFAYMASALTNLRLFNVGVHYLRNDLKLDLKSFFDFLLDTCGGQTPAFLEALERLRRIRRDILAEGATSLPMEEFGPRNWDPHESFFLGAVLDLDGFYDDLEAMTADYVSRHRPDLLPSVIPELVRFQRSLFPNIDGRTAAVEHYDYDWKAYYANLDRMVPNALNKMPVSLLASSPPVSTTTREEVFLEVLTIYNSERGIDIEIEESPSLDLAI